MARGKHPSHDMQMRVNGAAERRRRNAGQRVSYNTKDAFKDLNISGSDSGREEQDAGETEEPDGLVSSADEDIDPDETVAYQASDVAEGEDEEEDSDKDVAEAVTPKPIVDLRSSSIAAERPKSTLDSAPTTPVCSAKTKSLRTTGLTGVRCVGTPGVRGARYIPLGANTPGASTTRQRAVGEWREGGQQSRLRNLFGPAGEDLRPVIESKELWLSQQVLPSRSSRHLAPSLYVTQEAKLRDSNILRRWYANSGRAAFAQGQETAQLNEEQAQAYLANTGSESLELLMGGLEDQRIYSLKKGTYTRAGAPFEESDSKRKGWMLYLGSRVQDVHWAPNQHGTTQYLAVIVEQEDMATKKYKYFENPNAPAFTATNSFPASIQIWAFDAMKSGTLSANAKPRLEHVICTNWGAPQAIRWWPIGAEDSIEADQNGVIRLGLLAGIWSDGRVRVLDVSLQKSAAGSSSTQYVQYTKAALELAFLEPPSTDKGGEPVEKLSTLPSCLCWLSPTTIAVGTASGIIAIWTLTHLGMFPTPSTPGTERRQPPPWFHKQLADTYIVTVSSGYPARPQFLSLTTADGFARLIDLRAPLADCISSLRGRMIVHAQAWHEHTQSFVMLDEYYLLKHGTLRRYNQAIYTFRADSTLTTVATSPLHPAILVGSSDGSVAASNGLCKIMNSKDIPWSLTWFKHEYRRPVKDDGETDVAGDVVTSDVDASAEGRRASPDDPEVASRPLIRITEGYKPMQTSMQYPDAMKRQNDGAKFIAVFEEMSAVTRVEWNPNLKCGTWAVAGMQSGMLRVEDLGV